MRTARLPLGLVSTAVCLLAACLFAVPAPAQPAARGAAFDLDPQATHVRFTLGATMHTVHGTIRVRRGSLHLDPATGAASGEIVLDAASAETGNGSRDKDMHDKVLESGKYREIVWKIDRAEGFPRNAGKTARVTLSGSLAIHGASHPLSVPAEVTLAGDRGVKASAVLKIPYVAWGMWDPSSFVLRVDKEVAVEVQAVGHAAS